MNEIDIDNEPLVVSKSIMDKVLKDISPSDLLGLYMFYYYTAKWQKTNQPFCVKSYIMKALRWGNRKVSANKKKLKELGLIEDITTKDEKGKITGHYVRIKFIWRQETIGAEVHRVDNNTTNALSVNKKNIYKREKKIPTLEEVKEYVKEKNLHFDPKEFFDYYELGDWVDKNNKPVKNWKLKTLCWERNNQKPNKPNYYNNKPKEKHGAKGIRYELL